MCLTCICHEVLGDTLGFLQTLLKWPMILQLWHSLLTVGHLYLSLCICRSPERKNLELLDCVDWVDSEYLCLKDVLIGGLHLALNLCSSLWSKVDSLCLLLAKSALRDTLCHLVDSSAVQISIAFSRIKSLLMSICHLYAVMEFTPETVTSHNNLSESNGYLYSCTSSCEAFMNSDLGFLG